MGFYSSNSSWSSSQASTDKKVFRKSRKNRNWKSRGVKVKTSSQNRQRNSVDRRSKSRSCSCSRSTDSERAVSRSKFRPEKKITNTRDGEGSEKNHGLQPRESRSSSGTNCYDELRGKDEDKSTERPAISLVSL